jgi:hypothetical protein
MFVAIGYDQSPGTTIVIATSVDGGVTWQAQTSSWGAGPGYPSAVAWSSSLGLFVIVGLGPTAGDPSFLTSPNGSVWTPRSTPLDGLSVGSVVWAASLGMFVASAVDQTMVYPGTGYIATSTNGTTWTTTTVILNTRFRSLSWSPSVGRFVACLDNTSNYGPNYTSPDAINWQLQPWGTGIFNPKKAVWVDNIGAFVGVGRDGGNVTERVVATSFDGGVTPWVTRDSPFNNGTARSVGVADDGQVMVGGTGPAYGELMSSADGVHWRAQPSPWDASHGTIRAIASSPTVTVIGGI